MTFANGNYTLNKLHILNRGIYKLLTLTLLIFYTSINSIYAQQAGSNVFEFMNIANSSRVAAFGVNFLPTDDDDIDLAYANPSLINAEMHNQLSLNYVDYFAGINAGVVSYGYNFKKFGTFVGTMQFLSYGTMDETDYTGEVIGEFTGGEYAFIIGWSKALSEKFRMGVNLKNIFSSLDTYNSYGLAADVALTYSDREKFFSSSLIFKNMGRQVTTYTGEDNESLPFQVQLGIAKKFEHAPFRLLFLFNNLQTWDLKYNDPTSSDQIDPFTGEEKTTSKVADFGDNALRHMVLGAEFVPGKGNFMLRLGYNYRRQQEMKIASRSALVGFSFGVGLKVYKLKISYTRAVYHLSGGTNTISIGTDLDSFFSAASAE